MPKKKGTTILPRPSITFTLTGGEPLSSGFFPKFVSVDPANSFLITNASKLDNGHLEEVLRQGVRNFRISIHPEYRSRRVSQAIQENVKSLLRRPEEVHVRLNRVVRTNNPGEITTFLNQVSQLFEPSERDRIEGIAFIEESRMQQPGGKPGGDFDIFRLADDWAKGVGGVEISDAQLGGRKRVATLGKLKLEFVKLNCDATDDFILRCLTCVQEQDLAISADGRLRMCSTWDEELKPKHTYAHFDVGHPLIGISGAIRRKYGVAGFYGHFPMIIKALCGEQIHERFREPLFRASEMSYLLGIIHEPSPREGYLESSSLIQRIAELVLRPDPQVRKLYEEGHTLAKSSRTRLSYARISHQTRIRSS